MQALFTVLFFIFRHTVKKKFYDSSYTNIAEVISDIRLMIENCYRYNGSKHWISKLGQKLEKTIEQKINLFPR